MAGAIRGSGTTSNVRADLFGSERSCLDNKLENNQADFEVCFARLPLFRQSRRASEPPCCWQCRTFLVELINCPLHVWVWVVVGLAWRGEMTWRIDAALRLAVMCCWIVRPRHAWSWSEGKVCMQAINVMAHPICGRPAPRAHSMWCHPASAYRCSFGSHMTILASLLVAPHPQCTPARHCAAGVHASLLRWQRQACLECKSLEGATCQAGVACKCGVPDAPVCAQHGL